MKNDAVVQITSGLEDPYNQRLRFELLIVFKMFRIMSHNNKRIVSGALSAGFRLYPHRISCTYQWTTSKILAAEQHLSLSKIPNTKCHFGNGSPSSTI